MMTKKRSGANSNLKLMIVLPVVATVMMAFSKYAGYDESADPNVGLVTASAENTFIYGNLATPEDLGSSVSNSPAPASPPPPAARNEEAYLAENTVLQKAIPVEEQKAVEQEEDVPTEIFVVVEEPAKYPGGEAELFKFISDNITYPESAKTQNIQGRVILTFCVNYKGKIEQIKVLKGVDPDLDAEAMRVASLLPDWIPGKQGGKPVNVWFTLPVYFQLKQ